MNGTVLVVDDDPDMRELLQASLKTRGLDVVTASRLDAAVDLLRLRDVDLVLTDLMLDGESGLTLCRRVNELRPDVPVVMLAGFGTMESAVAAIRAGA